MLLWIWQLAIGIGHRKAGDVTLGHVSSAKHVTDVCWLSFHFWKFIFLVDDSITTLFQ